MKVTTTTTTSQTTSTTPVLPETPLEKLLFRKSELEIKTKIYEDKITDDLKFMQHNAGKMVISGVKTLFTGKDNKGSGAAHLDQKYHNAFESANLLSIAKGMILPVGLSLLQPLILSWGLGKVPTWIINFIIKRIKKK